MPISVGMYVCVDRACLINTILYTPLVKGSCIGDSNVLYVGRRWIMRTAVRSLLVHTVRTHV